MDKIIFNMATMPSRIESLKDTVASILPQCDQLNIYLNGFSFIPQFLNVNKINIIRSEECTENVYPKTIKGDIGDVGKFWKWDESEGYFFTCDDKFNYPPDYASKMIEYIEKYNRKAVFSLHGRIFPLNRLSKSYYNDVDQFLGCLQHVQEDTWVHELGTGVMAFHTDTLKPDLSIFKQTNMTDIYFSIYCQQLSIPLMVVKHSNRYLKIILKHDDRISIHANLNQRDKFQTEVINKFKWEINSL